MRRSSAVVLVGDETERQAIGCHMRFALNLLPGRPQEIPLEGAKVKLDFNKGTNTDTFVLEAPYVTGDIKIPKHTLPYRREGRFECLSHKDEGLVKGKWVKGETTARNEQRYITEMQQGKIDHKSDGMSSLVYELVSVENIADNAKLINVTL